MDEHDQERAAGAETLFRNVNESIERGQWPGDANAVGYRCECARLGCNELIELTPEEYAEVRAHSRRFLMVSGHELPDVEKVVVSGSRYVIVEKLDEAGAIADATEPRD